MLLELQKHTKSNYKKINDRQTGNDLEGSGSDLTEVLFRHLPEVTEEKQERSQNKLSPTRNLNTTSPNNKVCEFNISFRFAYIRVYTPIINWITEHL